MLNKSKDAGAGKSRRRKIVFAVIGAGLLTWLAWSVFLKDDLSDYQVNGKILVDEHGRQIILRGANAGGRSKLPPFFPFEPEPDFDTGLKKYADVLESLGFNVVRLLIMYEAAEPTRGKYDEEYLKKYDKMVAAFAERGFRVIVDSHQDAFSRRFCGDGFPDWMMPAKYRKKPHRSDCEAWELSYVSIKTGKSFDYVWSNTSGVLDRYVEFFGMLAERYRDEPAVIGFEPVNEPYPGWWGVSHYKRWHNERLYKFYEDVEKAVHKANPRFMVFTDICPMENPGLWNIDRRIPKVKNLVMAPHYYDMGYMKFGPFNLGGDIEAMRTGLKKHMKTAEEWDTPVFVGEYGVSMHRDDAEQYLTRLYTVFDEMQLSGTIWEASMSKTLWNMRDKAILNPDGTPRKAIYAIVRPYPRAVAGRIKSFGFDPGTNEFNMKWKEMSDIEQPTEIHLPKRVYKKGMTVKLSPNSDYTFNPDKSVLYITSAGGNVERKLKVRAQGR